VFGERELKLPENALRKVLERLGEVLIADEGRIADNCINLGVVVV
jgi:hypothetical protein